MARLIIVRHGNTFDPGDTPTRVGARTDLALSISGERQAAALAAHFRDTHFAAAFSSPLLRTRQTARAILAGRAGAPALLILPFLTEIDYGPDENQTEDVPSPSIEERLRWPPCISAKDLVSANPRPVPS